MQVDDRDWVPFTVVLKRILEPSGYALRKIVGPFRYFEPAKGSGRELLDFRSKTEWCTVSMSRKSSKRSTKTPRVSTARRPMSPEILARANEIVAGYRIVMRPVRGLGYQGYSLEVPTVFADGKTPELCARATLEAQAGYVAMLLEAGESFPIPVDEAKRVEQINIRVTPEEKLILSENARRWGFRNVSEFLRTTVLSAVRSEEHVKPHHSRRRAG